MRLSALFASLALAGCGAQQDRLPPPPVQIAEPTTPPVDGGRAPVFGAEPKAPPAATPIADRYRDEAARILEAAMADTEGWERLRHLTDRIGPRLAGSESLERAVAWAAAELEKSGLENVRLEKVMVPHWVRGAESAAIVAPAKHELAILGLGGTVATPKRGITAEVVAAKDWDELERLGDAVRGKIVLFTHAMPPYSEERGSGYDQAYEYRNAGAARAAKHGAAAVLVRSLTARSLSTPHTGNMRYEEGVRKIPAAAISTEGAELIARLLEAGQTVKVNLRLGARTLRDAESANVVAELVGREKPEEIVVLGAHIDSWDVGQGAHDDGGGCVTMMQAVALLKKLGLQPRRTIRVVLYTNEENGLRGGIQYAIDHADELEHHVAALESDTGTFAPRGIYVENSAAGLAQMRDIVSLLEPIGATRAEQGFAGADLIPITRQGVPGLGLWMDESLYFDYHHTAADTLDKVDPEDLRKTIAVAATVAYVLADMEERFGPGEAAPR